MSPHRLGSLARLSVAVLAASAVLASCGSDEASIQPTETTTTTDTEPDSTSASADDRTLHGVDLSGVDLPQGDPYDDYDTITDDTEQVEVDVPTDWDDVNTGLAERNGVEIPGIWASTDLEALVASYSVPGVQIDLRSASSPETLVALLNADNSTEEVCAETETFDYDDGLFSGVAELWTECGSENVALLHVVGERGERQYVTVEVQMLTDPDIDAALRVLETFTTVPAEPSATFETSNKEYSTAAGTQFTVYVSENPSVGDRWQVDVGYDDRVVEFLYRDFESDEPDAAGAGGTVYFTFRALAPGSTTVDFSNCRGCDGSGEGATVDTAALDLTVT